MIIFDTDACIELLRGNPSVAEKRSSFEDSVGVSFMTEGELFYGAKKSTAPEKNRVLVEKFLMTVETLQSTTEIMEKFGELKAGLEKSGIGLADADLLIAATALVAGAHLMTGNLKHFSRISQLSCIDWRD